jgi:S-adenosylmethionine:tRNA ribosyltransferase-isomerase
MKVSDFDYDLPQELIAQKPLENRVDSRLLVLDKKTGEMQHKKFPSVLEFLNEGDSLVLNDTRVMPARILGTKKDTGANIEFLILKRVEDEIWEVILKPGRKAQVGSRFVFGQGELEAEVLSIVADGNRLVRFYYDGIFEEILDQVGLIPLPPYITESLRDKERYQTVYAKDKGSAAAPTAGLHFTKDLLLEIEKKGVQIVYLTLHVGLGTFRPVKVEDVKGHHMHSEYYVITEEACKTINQTKAQGKKVVAVGTTSVRVLETVANKEGKVFPKVGETDIFIYPGYDFKCVDTLITNFHLPQSTLLMLVSALAGRDNILKAYQEAVMEQYRFFSFGDAMIIF